MNFQVYEAGGHRFKFAIERFIEGRPFDFHGVTIGWSSGRPRTSLEILASSSRTIEEITEESAWEDIERAQDRIKYLGSKSGELAKLFRTHPHRYSLINDYGTGAVEVCRLVDGKLVWAKGFDSVG